jgi:hypothetical protein
MNGDDMFRLFQANANGMEEFARLAGQASQARSRVQVAELEVAELPEIELREIEQSVAEVPLVRRVQAIEAKPEIKRSWWERVGLVPTQKKSRRRLNRSGTDMAGFATGT